jgi:hypothetical protein
MPGPTQPWDQSGDSRESTVDLPRLDVSGLADYLRGASPLPAQEPAGLLEPLPAQEQAPESRSSSMPPRAPRPSGIRNPYPEPDVPHEAPASRPSGLPVRAAGRATAPSRAQPPGPGPGREAIPSNPIAPSPVTPNLVASNPVTPNAVAPNGVTPNLFTPNPAAPNPAAPNPVVPNRVTPNAAAPNAVTPNLFTPNPATPNPATRNPVVITPAPAPRAEPEDIDAVARTSAATLGLPPTALTPAVLAPPRATEPPAEPMPAAAAAATLAARTGARGRPTGSRPAGRAPVGSLADLRSRLARLPDGHPSSPYDDGGRAKPLPIRLKQLELGLPAPGRELSASFRPDVESDDIELDPRWHLAEPELRDPELRDPELAQPDQPRPDPSQPERSEPERSEPEPSEPNPSEPDFRAAGAPARKDASPQSPDLAAAYERAADIQPEPTQPPGSTRTPAAEVVPTPFPAREDASSTARPEWANPYAGSSNGRAAPGTPADLTLGPWLAAPPPRVTGLEGLSARGGNGHGPSNGHGNGSRPRSSQRGPDRPDRGRGDAAWRDTAEHRTVEPATADLRALVERKVASSRAAEGRNALGSYGSSGLTPAIQRLAAHLPFGGLAPGSEADSLKSPERLAAKLARLIARNPGRTPEELAASISDAVRYAFAFEAADYVEGTWLVHRRLKSHGFELEIRRNRWESPEYKGIFTQWRDPAHHLAFEVQFHTAASWSVVQRTHDAYVQITDPATPPAERARLRARQVAAAVTAKAPPNWAEISDFRLEPR